MTEACGEDGPDPIPAGEMSDGKQVEPISQMFRGCLDRYYNLYLALGGERCQAVKLNQVSLEKAGDEYSRLRLWGIQNMAALPAQVRGSLDDTLRYDETLRTNVTEIFRLLNDQLDQGTELGFAPPPSPTSDMELINEL